MNRGLSALPVKRFQTGGFSVGPAAPSNPAVGMMGLTAPAMAVNTPVASFNVTPMDVVSLAVPALAPVNMAINAINALSAMNTQQAPAPISEAVTAEQAEAAMDAMDATVAASQEAEDAAMGLAAMNTAQAAEAEASEADAATDAVSAAVDSVDAAVGEAAADAAAAASDAGTAGDAGTGGDSGGSGDGSAGAGSAGDGSGDGSGGDGGGDGGGSAGERAGGIIKRYQYGGGVMGGMGDSSPQYSYAPLMMAEGGLAAAQKAQAMGRGQDTMLVHMTPGEVKGLQALAMSQGGSLSINPKTGLPEAGILSTLLPLAAGFALGPAGFNLMGAGMAGLTVGALTTAATGSLKKGIMAGLGAYGGAGLGEGLVNAATPMESAVTLPEVAGAEGYGLASNAPMSQAQAMDVQAMFEPGITSTTPAPPQIPTSTPSMTPAQIQDVRAMMEPGIVSGNAPIQPTGFEAAKSGFENVFKSAGEGGAEARARFGAALPFGTTIAAGAPLTMAAMEPPAAPKPSASYVRPYKVDVENISGTPAYEIGSSYERPQVTYNYTPMPMYRAAQGGPVDPDSVGDGYSMGGVSDGYKEGGLSALARQRELLAGGGALPPRFLSGGGDGMSDSIKANIDGVQEARLADGEFVVPADVVSHLGNGSSKAGAKKLYSMMDKIRKARTGSTRQAPEVNAQKYMPA